MQIDKNKSGAVAVAQQFTAIPGLTGHTAMLQDSCSHRLYMSAVDTDTLQMRKSIAALTLALFSGSLTCISDARAFDAKYQDAFASRVGNPGETSALSAFVRVAVEAGQYDQALSTIEEHLINYPLDPKAHLIAARLYHHVGSRELAARHLEIALDIGTLEPADERAAKRLLASVERALSSISGYLNVTAGVRSETYDFVPTAAWADRTDTNAFIVTSGLLRIDLETSTNNAILLFAEAGTGRRFGDFNFDGIGGVYTAPHGRAGVTLDVGLPTGLVPTLRGQLTGFTSYETYDSNLYRRIYGTTLRLTAAPTANSFVYAEGGYAWLGESATVLREDYRYTFEGGMTYRIFRSHTIGIAGRGYRDYAAGMGRIGHLHEAEFSYAGQVVAFDAGPVWTQSAGVAFGELEIPDIIGGTIFGDYWRAYWTHSLQIDDRSRIDLDLSYRDTTFDNIPNQDHSKFAVSLGYTVSLY